MPPKLLLFVSLLIASGAGAVEGEYEHAIVFGVGGAMEGELSEGRVHGGTNVFVEWKAIAPWLELELGVSVLPEDPGREMPIDLLLKRSIQLTRRLEVMPGLGPELIWVSGTKNDGVFGGVEVVADFMYWPSRHVGFWVEPSYDMVFHDGVAHGLGSTGGLILGW